MARPKLGESETERLHVKITSDEITAIDDWRYANRVPSRSEAVRRLCQIGLGFDALADSVEADAISLVETTSRLAREHLRLNPRESSENESWKASWFTTAGNIRSTLDAQTALALKIGAISEPTRQMRNHATFEEAMKNANSVLEVMLKHIEETKSSEGLP